MRKLLKARVADPNSPKPRGITLRDAHEMVVIGIAGSHKQLPIGTRFDLAGRICLVTGYATRAEFIEAAERVFPEKAHLFQMIDAAYYLRISAD